MVMATVMALVMVAVFVEVFGIGFRSDYGRVAQGRVANNLRFWQPFGGSEEEGAGPVREAPE